MGKIEISTTHNLLSRKFHHHHHVACPCRSVAVSTISRHSSRLYALCRADHRPRFCCLRSSTVRSRVCRGRPRGRLQSFGGSSMPALRARVWSSSESERTIWPKNIVICSGVCRNIASSCPPLLSQPTPLRLLLLMIRFQRQQFVDMSATRHWLPSVRPGLRL